MQNQSFHHGLVRQDQKVAAKFVDGLRSAARADGAVLDSAAADEFVSEVTHGRVAVPMPTKLQAVLDEAGEHAGRVTRAILDSVTLYEDKHGQAVPADLLVQAVHSAYASTTQGRRALALDSATSAAHDPQGLQPNRAIVSIVTTLGEGIPFAGYLPPDIGSNKAVLAIMSNKAGNTYGAYTENGLMDGALSGETYISSARVHTAGVNGGGSFTGKLTRIQDTSETCDQAAPGVKLLRGRSVVYINGRVAGREVDTTGAGNSTVSGGIELNGVRHIVSGSVNTDTGEFALSVNPVLPANHTLLMEGFVDYERSAELTPRIITAVETFELFADPWRVTTLQTVDSRTQMSNELGIDPYSQSLMAVQAQFGNERHYSLLRKAMRSSVNNMSDFDFDWARQKTAKDRAMVWRDVGAVLGAASQLMAMQTMNHGITHLYVGRGLATEIMALPAEIFTPSGIQERPGIFRVGRLFGRYEVYYTPKVVQETADTAQMLCIGKATDTARNPFILGDAVPVTTMPLAMGERMESGAGFYARVFTEANPHAPSSMGCARINIINRV